MATISVHMSYTIDYVNQFISFGKIDAQLDGIDLDGDIDEQLKNTPVALDKTSIYVANFLRAKVNKVFNKTQEISETKHD